ncbi:glycoside hydrolase family 27 protein [[Hallella] seregens]|uniref:Alpha-galactosidase n=1 Tax=Hallella seregens ATCC 51272 TaxID=1336250 RepID=A0ABV5ZI68_9BACT|nr:glycoside hydrolase family 27 protein [Hallella seregens]
MKRILYTALLLLLPLTASAVHELRCAKSVFSQPGVRFMQKIRTTHPQAVVRVSGLPFGLKWNAQRNLVEGKVKSPGTYTYVATLTENGQESQELITLTVSDKLALPLPFMGWLSWNSVEGDVSEAIVKQVADLFHANGLYEAGWNTVMMDDLWQARQRAADGKPLPDPQRFPSGLRHLADYVHGKGMKFGLYTDAADKTCAGAFGSYGYEKIDADQYAEWHVDVVKCDYCHAPLEQDSAIARYSRMGEAFKAARRPLTLYLCEWGGREPWLWGAEAGGSCWRISPDVRDGWTCEPGGAGVVQSIDIMKNIAEYSGVNRFNDADMLCVGLHGKGKSSNDLCFGKPGMTQDEYRTQFALWCMWSSPMALSFDPRANTLTSEDLEILKNRHLIALNQDRMGQQAELVSEADSLIVFAKDLENGDVAVSVTNLADREQKARLDLSKIPALSASKRYHCLDLWTGQPTADVKGSFSMQVRPHATAVFRLGLQSLLRSF